MSSEMWKTMEDQITRHPYSLSVIVAGLKEESLTVKER